MAESEKGEGIGWWLWELLRAVHYCTAPVRRRAIMNGAGTAPCDGRRHVSFAVVCRSLPCFAVLFSSQAHVHSMSEKMSGWCWIGVEESECIPYCYDIVVHYVWNTDRC